MTATPAPAWSRRVALVVAAAFFIEQVDGTVLATAAPAIADDFGVQPADVGIAMTAYLAAVAVFIPASGWLAGRLGTRRLFLAAVLLFVAASLACGFSTSLALLTGIRVVQGIAGSMMVPIGRLIVLGSAEKSELMRAVAYLTWPALAAPVVAPFIGGVLTQFAGWQWIFFVNVPLGGILLLVALRVIPTSAPSGTRPFDSVGFGLAGVSIATLVFGLDGVASASSTLAPIVLLSIALVSAVAALRWFRRGKAPLLDFTAFRHPTFRISNSSGVLWRLTVNSAPFLLPLLLQDGFGWTPVQAGLMVMWVFVGNLGVKPFTTPLMQRFGFSTVIIGSGIGLTLTLVAAALVTTATPIVVIAGVFLASGVFRSTGFTAYNTLQFADVPAAEMTGANTVASTLAQLAAGLGVAIGAVGIRLGDGVAGALGSAPAALPYRVALMLMAILAIVSMLGGLRLPAGAADHVRTRT